MKRIDAAALKILQEPDDTHMYVNELMKSSENEQIEEPFWFPTPEKQDNDHEHTPIQRPMLKETRELNKKEESDQSKKKYCGRNFLTCSSFNVKDFKFEGEDRKQLEQTKKKQNTDMFARHSRDIGSNKNFKVQLTPKNESPAYTQSQYVPMKLKEDLTVELPVMHRYSLPISKFQNTQAQFMHNGSQTAN